MKKLILAFTMILLAACAEDGTNGADGIDGTGGLQDIFEHTQAIYNEYRQSMYRIEVFCGTTWSGSSGSGFRISETEVATNKHVTSLDCGAYTKSFKLEYVDNNLDTIDPSTAIIIYNPANESTEYDLAKIYVPASFHGTPVTLASSPFYLTGDTGTYTVSMSYPWGFQDLYTILGHVSANYTCFYDEYECPGYGYDFIVTQDTDHGSSGSPVFNMGTGEVIGITSAGIDGINMNPAYIINANKLNTF